MTLIAALYKRSAGDHAVNVTMLVLNSFTHDARVHKEAKTLAAAGHNVQVLALYKAGLAIEERVHGYHVRRLVLKSVRWQGGRLAPAIKYLELIRRVAQVTKLRPADVYHSHDANTLLAIYPVVRRDKAAWVYDSHELETGRNFGGSKLAGIYRWLWPLPERLFIRRVNTVISANPSYAGQLVNTYGIRPPTVIMNCPEYLAPLESSLLRDKLGIPTGRTIILYQGAIAFNRGLEVCIQSLQYVGTDVDLVALGDGRARGALEALAAELDLSDRVHFPGYVPLAELLAFTASADVGLSLIQNTCQSYYFTLPNKIMEYLMAGLPIVASDFPEMRRVIQKHQVGYLVSDPSSPQEVAATITKTITDRERYRQMRLNAHRAAEVLNWENERKKLIALYDDFAR